MQEIELKFLVPESRLKGLMRQVKVKSSKTIQLAAHYYDAPDQQLAQAGIGLRIRKEGDTWVQTIKAGGDGIAARLEHNAVLDNEQVQAMLDNDALMPDLSIYKDSAVYAALEDFKLKKLAKNLTRLYVTDVQRTTRLLVEKADSDTDDSHDNRIEMAYDQGEIIHGTDDTQRDAIQEIEFELVSGDLDFLFMTAKTWCKRYKLCLSTVTKAERGSLLIKNQSHSPAVSADLSQLKLDKKISMPAFLRAVVHNCLLHILPNSSAIVAGSTAYGHLLQLQIGIDRLRAALTAFAEFSDAINPDWELILKQTADLLSDYNKLTYLANHIEPKLQKHGAPATDWAVDIETLNIKPIDAVRANDLQLTLLELMDFAMSDPHLDAQADMLAIDQLTKTLSQQRKNIIKFNEKLDDTDNAKLDSDDTQNTASKDNDEEQTQQALLEQLKALRYISEFSAPLFNKKDAKKKTKHWLKRLIKAQKSLGKYLDNIQYQQYYQSKSAADAKALYGVSWFAATLKNNHKHAEKRLNKVKDSSIFW